MLDHIYWAIEGHVIVHELSGEVTLQDIITLTQRMGRMIDADEQISYVDVLYDITHVTNFHRDVMNIKNLFSSVKKHDRIRWNIVVNPNPNPVVHFVTRTVGQLFKKRVRIMPDQDTSLHFLDTEAAVEQD